MKIAIIGAGTVGRALGEGWAAKGHEIMFGVRSPGSPKLADLDHARFKIGKDMQAAQFGEVVVLATPWDSTKEAIAACGDLHGKIVLDATNPLRPNMAGLAMGHITSGGEKVAEWANGAKVVKVFNTTGYRNMAHPRYGKDHAAMLYCGDDAKAKDVARKLADDLGFDAIDFGPLANARYTEPFAMVWIWLAVNGGQGRDIAFKLMRR